MRKVALVYSGALALAWSAASASEVVTYEYDPLGRVVEVRHSGGPNNNVEVKYQYDPAGNRTQDSVSGANHPPVAGADTKVAVRNTPISFDPRGNDTDPNGGDVLTITAVTQPAHGTASFTGTALTYTPATGYTGPDSFTYTISDGRGASSTATVTMTVHAPPTAVNDSFLVQQGVATALHVLGNDSDPEGDPLVVQSATQGAKGATHLNHVPYVVYTSTAGASGADSFTYTVSDGRGGTAVGTVSVAINRPPVTQADSFIVQQGVATALHVMGNDSDPDGDPFSVQVVTQGAQGSTHLNHVPYVVYTSTASASGSDSVQYTVHDNRGGAATGTLNLVINRPPVANNDTGNVTAGQSFTVLVSSNDSDPDGDTRTITNVSTPAKGTAAINGGAIVYTANTGTSGTDAFTYTIADGRGGSATATVTMTVAGVNRPPVAVNDPTINILRGTSVNVNPLTNDSDPDGDALTITGATVIAGATKVSVVQTSSTQLRVTGNAGGVGTVSYTISDGRGGTASASFTVQVEF